MMKLLIVDDEQVGREGLQAILQKSFTDLIIEQAQNGKIAIRMAEEFRPDLILMDIRMPGMDGLETTEHIGMAFPDIKVIMVTAYDTFEYARRAIKLGVKDYLLKPSKAGEIVATVQKVLEQIIQERKDREQSELRNDALQKMMPVIEADIVTQLLFDHVHQVHSDELVRWLGVDTASEKFALAVLLPPGQEQAYGAIKAKISYTGSGWVGALYGRQIPVIAFRKPGTSFRAQASALARDLLSAAGVDDRQGWFVGIGNTYESLAEVRQSYQQALIATMDISLPVKYRFYTDVTAADTAHQEHVHAGRSWEQRFFEQVRLGEWERIREETLDLLRQYENRGTSRLQAQQRILERIWIASRVLTEIGVEITTPMYSFEAQDYRQLRIETGHILNHLEQSYQEHLERIKPDTIRQIKQYITEHSHEDISLEGIGQKFELSPFYISKLFKEQLGINYIDFLTECRILKAKKLMSDPMRSMKEITFEVGYHDPNYFSKVFKKMCEVSPTEYRKTLLGGSS
ncbi:response regulator [Paenibacillus bovis]|uniref:DNA-binding response regulator n=1 Tax=Paenibacillus bovis TaxID=1616788 RepID=A0A172ZHF4_9BACL|nr:response regulator [Paenibacillus bovis]ANF96959.1 DNA-binding response regulator [Paenibacillus bovis]